MKNMFNQWRQTWNQRALTGAHMILSKRKRWGFNTETLDQFGRTIPHFLQARYSAVVMRRIQGSLKTTSIDELITDLNIAARTMEVDSRGERGNVDDRLVYVSFEDRSMYSYLATVNGTALSPLDAWHMFHKIASQLAETVDTLFNEEDSDTDLYYFTHRYGSLWTEVLTVYRLFAELAGFNLPPFA